MSIRIGFAAAIMCLIALGIGLTGCGTLNVALYQNEFDTKTATQTTFSANDASSNEPPYLHINSEEDPIEGLIKKTSR
jgi:hypothetical protein